MNSSWLWKIPLVALIGIAIGLSLAQLMIWRNLRDDRESFFQGRWATTGQTGVGNTAGLEIRGKSTIDLGLIESGRRVERELMLENRATGGAEFWLAGSPPAALQTDIPVDVRTKVESKGTYPLALFCTPNQLTPDFKKLLVLQTNQGDRKLVVTVTAKISGGIAVTPERLALARNVWQTTAPLLINVLSSQDAAPEIKAITVRGLGSPEWLKTAIDPVPETAWPDLQQTVGSAAKSGWQISLSPGTPLPTDLKEFTLLIGLKTGDYALLEVPVTIAD